MTFDTWYTETSGIPKLPEDKISADDSTYTNSESWGNWPSPLVLIAASEGEPIHTE